MNKTRISLAAFAALTLSVACRQEIDSQYRPAFEHSFSVMAELPPIEQDVDTKGYLGSYINASWTKDDKVSVVNLTTGKILGGDLVADRTGTNATFNGTVTGSISAGDVISLFYPSFGVGHETDFQTYTIDISEQNTESKVPLVASSTFTAESSGGEIAGLQMKFYYILSYLKINMANLPENAAISKITLRNMPNSFSVSIDSTGTGFQIGTAAKGKINLSGQYTTSASGTLTAAVGITPSDESSDRAIMVTAEDKRNFISPMTSAKLSSHKYYNTIASQFEQLGIAGQDGYGIYNLSTSSVVDSYIDYKSTLIVGEEDAKTDFTLFNPFTYGFWTLKGIPTDVAEGDSFPVSLQTYGIGLPSLTDIDKVTVRLIEQDGDFSKVWIKHKDILFIVRK